VGIARFETSNVNVAH